MLIIIDHSTFNLNMLCVYLKGLFRCSKCNVNNSIHLKPSSAPIPSGRRPPRLHGIFVPLGPALPHKVQRVQDLVPGAAAAFGELALYVVLLHPVAERLPRHAVLVRRRVNTVALLHGDEGLAQVLRGVLLVRLLLEHVRLDVDDGVGPPAHDPGPRVDVQRYAVLHVDKVARHDFRGRPHTCNERGEETAL